ncbi:hypothetical protein OG257_36945 [Streptomyces sp. NBC_00683]|uniref:hypothetical protein n=1 Tax=Streptomyces sp. NBC_00683 TaxID=2903670 RepID=UPI002E370BD2|nr:hypothetical protein [Streptomyces sp. NBC_00683]
MNQPPWVARPGRRGGQLDVASRSINARGVWGRAVDAWIEEDLAELDVIWDQIIEDIGSEYDAYSNVSSIGWAAGTEQTLPASQGRPEVSTGAISSSGGHYLRHRGESTGTTPRASGTAESAASLSYGTGGSAFLWTDRVRRVEVDLRWCGGSKPA